MMMCLPIRDGPGGTFFKTPHTMAKKISDSTKYVTLLERDYLTLISDHMVLRALKIAGIEKSPIFEAVESILKDGRVEIHIRPVDKRYR